MRGCCHTMHKGRPHCGEPEDYCMYYLQYSLYEQDHGYEETLL